jgi:hypothetical protein
MRTSTARLHLIRHPQGFIECQPAAKLTWGLSISHCFPSVPLMGLFSCAARCSNIGYDRRVFIGPLLASEDLPKR